MFDIRGFCRSAFQSTNKLSVKAVTRSNLPYIWGLIAAFVWLYAYFLPMGDFSLKADLFEAIVGDRNFYFYTLLLSGSLIPLLFDGKRFVPASFYSVILSLVCFIAVLFLGPGTTAKIIMLIAVPCIGHIFISHVYSFFMVLNNSEKFYSMILVVLLPKALMYIKPVLSNTQAIILIFFIMLSLALSTYIIKSHRDRIPSLQKVKAPLRAYSLMPVIFIVFALNDVIAPGILQQMRGFTQGQLESFYFLGILAGLAVTIFLQTRLSVNICIMLNLSFTFLAIGLLLNTIQIQYPRCGTCIGPLLW